MHKSNNYQGTLQFNNYE